MKKYLITFAIAIMLGMMACNPSAKQVEEKRVADSIRCADSLAILKAQEARKVDSIAKFKADSLKADSIKKASLKKPAVKKAHVKKAK